MQVRGQLGTVGWSVWRVEVKHSQWCRGARGRKRKGASQGGGDGITREGNDSKFQLQSK